MMAVKVVSISVCLLATAPAYNTSLGVDLRQPLPRNHAIDPRQHPSA
jgi:hypothetical protein